MPEGLAQERPHAMPLVLLGLLALGHGAAFADRNLPAAAAPLMKAQLALSDAQLGLLDGPAFVLLYAAGMLASAPLAGGARQVPLLAACIALWGAGMVGFALAGSFAGLLAARAVVGLGQAAFVPLALGLIMQWTPAPRRARSIAVFTAGAVLGRGLSMLLAGAVLAALARWWPGSRGAHWRLLFLVLAAPNLLLIASLLAVRWRPPVTGRTRPVCGAPLHGWLRRHALALAGYFTAAGCSVVLTQTIGAWAPSVLQREHALSPALAALAFGTALMVAVPAGHLLAGALVDRRGWMTPMRLTGAALVAATLPLAVVPWAPSASVACVGLALASLAGGTAAVAALAGLPSLVPPSLRDPATRGFLVFVTLVGVGLGPYVAGLVSDGLGPGGRGLSTALAIVCLGAAACGLLASVSVPGGWAPHRMEAGDE